MTWGFAIPGLAMAASELPPVEGLFPLENPEIGDGVVIGSTYTLEDIADMHLQTIRRSARNAESLTLIGISMGAMIVAILATERREKLPSKLEVRLLSAAANTYENPAVPDAFIEEWRSVHPGDEQSFERALRRFFSPQFREQHPERFSDYVRYRSSGRNRQSEKALRRQTAALRAFHGASYYPRLDPDEANFHAGAEDDIFGASYQDELRRMVPGARFEIIREAGHMLHMEQPNLYQPVIR
ncbi:MAG: alpha/beta fold hydrolase [Bdellovibrionota bacterium]